MIQEEDDPLALAMRKVVAAHQIGQSVEDLSLDEISVRIEILQREIERLMQMRKAKEDSRAVAAAFFKI